ncbi:hypothetical protein [Actinacidiphila glaucinigra]|uniref:DinB/UmuC family translesion DNA polymerase n=1 Tax=Actinacidiphila glaucinigra TaxID=235986 RepID=UPI0036E22BF8
MSRSRTLAERSAFTDDLRDAAIAVFERLGPKRARVRGVSVRAEHLVDAADVPQQLSLDPGREPPTPGPGRRPSMPASRRALSPGARSPTAAAPRPAPRARRAATE